jgi:hypothetical protein
MVTLGFFKIGMKLVQSWEGVVEERCVLLLLTVAVYRS